MERNTSRQDTLCVGVDLASEGEVTAYAMVELVQGRVRIVDVRTVRTCPDKVTDCQKESHLQHETIGIFNQDEVGEGRAKPRDETKAPKKETEARGSETKVSGNETEDR